LTWLGLPDKELKNWWLSCICPSVSLLFAHASGYVCHWMRVSIDGVLDWKAQKKKRNMKETTQLSVHSANVLLKN